MDPVMRRGDNGGGYHPHLSPRRMTGSILQQNQNYLKQKYNLFKF